MLSPLYMLITSVITEEDSFIYIILSAMPIGCLYTIPFWFSLTYIRKYYVEAIGKCILWDMAVCLVPAVLGILLSEIVYTVVSSSIVAAGVVTLIFGLIFVLISLIFLLLYYIFSRVR